MTDTSIDPTVAQLRKRLAAVLIDLNAVGTADGEAMYVLGASVAGLCDRGGAPNWTAFKDGLPTPDYDRLRQTLQSEGRQMVAEGKTKAAYAIQAIGISLLAGRYDDVILRDGVALIDQVIDVAVDQVRKNAPKAQ